MRKLRSRESLIIDKPRCRRCDGEIPARSRYPVNPASRVLHPKERFSVSRKQDRSEGHPAVRLSTVLHARRVGPTAKLARHSKHYLAPENRFVYSVRQHYRSCGTFSGT